MKDIKILLFVIIQFIYTCNCSNTREITDNYGQINCEEGYFIDYDSGSDDNEGTSPESAWKHAPGDPSATGNANIILQPSDVVIFKGGVHYKSTISINASGSSINPITYKGDCWGQAKAVFDGSELLTGWTKCSSSAECGGNSYWANIYYTSVPSGTTPLTSNLYQDDEMLYISQEPNPPDPFFMDDLDSYYLVSNLTQTTATDTWFNDIGGNELINSFVFAWRSPSEVDFRKITNYNSSTNTITFNALGAAPYSTSDRWKLAVANNINDSVFNRVGEYFYDESAGKIYLWPIDGKDPNTCNITISTRSVGFNTGNHDYVTIEGFIFQKGIVRASSDAALSTSSGITGLVFRNNEIIKWRSESINNVTKIYSVSSALIENNKLTMNARLRGFDVTGDNITIKDNTLIKIGRTPIAHMSGDNCQIIGNYVYNCLGVHSNGISAYQGSNNTLISGNRVFKSNFPITLQDCTNVSIINNIFHGDNENPSLCVWTGSSINNLIIKHNLLIGAGGWGTGFYSQVDTISGLIMKNNVIQGVTYISGSGNITHNIYTVTHSPLNTGEFVVTDMNALFVDPASNDYHLKVVSPAINKGTYVGIVEDIEHNIRSGIPDIGPYETN